MANQPKVFQSRRLSPMANRIQLRSMSIFSMELQRHKQNMSKSNGVMSSRWAALTSESSTQQTITILISTKTLWFYSLRMVRPPF